MTDIGYDVETRTFRSLEKLHADPDLVEQFGEDPLRYLSFWTLGYPEEEFKPRCNAALCEARIRGIVDRELLYVYRGLEHKHFDGRKEVLQWIADREQAIDDTDGSAENAPDDDQTDDTDVDAEDELADV